MPPSQRGRWVGMGLSRADEDLSVSFVPDDKQRRLDFGRRLAAYVRSHRERWDITAVLEPLQLLAGKTGQVGLHLHRSPPGRLAVTIHFELEPALPPPTGCDQRASDRSPAAGTSGTDFEPGATPMVTKVSGGTGPGPAALREPPRRRAWRHSPVRGARHPRRRRPGPGLVPQPHGPGWLAAVEAAYIGYRTSRLDCQIWW